MAPLLSYLQFLWSDHQAVFSLYFLFAFVGFLIIVAENFVSKFYLFPCGHFCFFRVSFVLPYLAGLVNFSEKLFNEVNI